MNVQQVAVERAKVLLAAAKVDWAIRFPDGTVEGTLIVKPPAKQPKTDRTVKYRWDKDLGYIEKVRAMQPGDTLSWTIADGHAGEHFRGAVSGTCSRAHGPGACIVVSKALDDGSMTVECLRVT